jgi:NADPH:quinone reductase
VNTKAPGQLHRKAPGATLAAYGRVGNETSAISISDFYRQAWNARIVGFISPVPDETKGEDLAILTRLVANGHLRPRISLVLGWERPRRHSPRSVDARCAARPC